MALAGLHSTWGSRLELQGGAGHSLCVCTKRLSPSAGTGAVQGLGVARRPAQCPPSSPFGSFTGKDIHLVEDALSAHNRVHALLDLLRHFVDVPIPGWEHHEGTMLSGGRGMDVLISLPVSDTKLSAKVCTSCQNAPSGGDPRAVKFMNHWLLAFKTVGLHTCQYHCFDQIVKAGRRSSGAACVRNWGSKSG